MDKRRLLWIVLVAATALRVVIAARVPLVDDEAYYWAWAQRLAWGYPDHPPAIAALIRATSTILGDGSLGVRAGPIFLNLCTVWLLYDLGRSMFDAEVGAVAALWFQTIPLFSVVGILSVPDAPFIFFWMLAMWAMWRAVTRGGIAPWLLAGTAVGFAALSKLAALFLGISLAGYLLWGERQRRWWRRPEPYAAAALAIALIVPMLRWNLAHDWVMGAKAREPIRWLVTGIPALNALAYAGAQFAYYGPATPLLLAAATVAAWRASRASDPRYVYALWAIIPITGFFAAASFDGIARPHWPAPAYLVALIPAAALWISVRERRRWRRLVTAGIAVNLLVVTALGALLLWPRSPVVEQLRAWEAITSRLQQLVEATPSTPGRFILIADYQTAAQVEYHLRGALVATPAGSQEYALAYAEWVNNDRLLGWNAVYLTERPAPPGLPLTRMFRQVDALPPITVEVPGRGARTFAAYRGFGFMGYPRPAAQPL